MGEEIEQDLLAKINEAIGDLLSKLGPLQTQLSKLKDLLKNQANLSSAANNSRRPPPREKLYHLNNVLTEWLTLSKKQSSYSPEAILFSINLNRTLKEIRRELGGGDASGTTTTDPTQPLPTADSTASSNRVLEPYRWSSRSVDEAKVHGFDHEKMSLERVLVRTESQDTGFKAIGIVGMRGVGKTTLCQLIFNSERVKEHFLPRIWVCMSKQPKEDSPNLKEIVKRILICLGVEEDIIKSIGEKHNLPGLLFALRLQLMGKKYLIVLDDAWNEEDQCFNKLSASLTPNDENWGEKLAYGLPKGHGGTIVVTSRSEKVAKEMVGEENLRRLSPLEDKESCWLIFKDSVAEDDTEFPQELANLKEEVIKKCGGLPLAAKMMGQIKHQQLVISEGKHTESRQDQQQQPPP